MYIYKMGSITYTNTCACTRENERERAREREKERDMVPWHIVSTSVLSVLVTEEKKKKVYSFLWQRSFDQSLRLSFDHERLYLYYQDKKTHQNSEILTLSWRCKHTGVLITAKKTIYNHRLEIKKKKSNAIDCLFSSFSLSLSPPSFSVSFYSGINVRV